MCGRFVSSTSPQDLARYFEVDVVSEQLANWPVNYNTAPTNMIMVVAQHDGTRTLEALRWGLVPSWAEDPAIGSRMINARAETVATKPSFRAAFRRRRCIIPADGFYEWVADPGDRRKQPFYIHRPDGEPYAFAGLWEQWSPDGAPGSGRAPEGNMRTCTMITTAANTRMSRLHDRMPAVLERSQWDAWLDPDLEDGDLLSSFLVPAPDDLITFHPVSKAVNSVRSSGAELAVEVPTTLF